MLNKVDMCYTIDSGLNFSEHLPLVLGCQLPASPLSACQSIIAWYKETGTRPET